MYMGFSKPVAVWEIDSRSIIKYGKVDVNSDKRNRAIRAEQWGFNFDLKITSFCMTFKKWPVSRGLTYNSFTSWVGIPPNARIYASNFDVTLKFMVREKSSSIKVFWLIICCWEGIVKMEKWD